MLYLLKYASKFRTVFTVGFLTSRSLKLDPMLICFHEHKKKIVPLAIERKTENEFFPCFFLFERHGCAFHEGKIVPLTKAKRSEERRVGKEC